MKAAPGQNSKLLPRHSLENIGETDLDNISVEVKDQA